MIYFNMLMNNISFCFILVTKFSSNFFSSTPFLAKSTETADVNKNDDDDESEILPEPEIKT